MNDELERIRAELEKANAALAALSSCHYLLIRYMGATRAELQVLRGVVAEICASQNMEPAGRIVEVMNHQVAQEFAKIDGRLVAHLMAMGFSEPPSADPWWDRPTPS